MATMEPIPLRTLTTLLNYEKTISDPRFKDTLLYTSSFGDPKVIQSLAPDLRRQILDIKPATVTQVNMHVFVPSELDPTNSLKPSPHPPADVFICPDTDPAIQALSAKQRETIYHEAHDHDGCYKAITLYQEFFFLCPLEQQISIQIRDEEPVLVDPYPRNILEFNLSGPKLLTITSRMPSETRGPLTIVTGGEEGGLHAVVSFPNPKSADPADAFVVDMTRLQWGNAGRGPRGEKYFMGTLKGFRAAMGKVCGGMRELGIGADTIRESEHTQSLQACAKRAWERWINRDVQGWCEYCGVGGENLRRCTGCEKKKVFYCCKDHQEADRKLHKFTCEKSKKA